jgi:hypothetical protein
LARYYLPPLSSQPPHFHLNPASTDAITLAAFSFLIAHHSTVELTVNVQASAILVAGMER